MRIPLFETLLIRPDWTSLDPETVGLFQFYSDLAQGRVLPIMTPQHVRGWIKLADFDAAAYLTPAVDGGGVSRPALELGVKLVLQPWLDFLSGLPPRQVVQAVGRFLASEGPAPKAVVRGKAEGLPWRLFLAPDASRERVAAALRLLAGDAPVSARAPSTEDCYFSALAWVEADPDARWILEPLFDAVWVVDGWQVVPLTWDLPDVYLHRTSSFRWNDREWLVAAYIRAWGSREHSTGLQWAFPVRVEPAWQWGNDAAAALLVTVLRAWPAGEKALFVRTSRGFHQGVVAVVGLQLSGAEPGAVRWVLERALALAESGMRGSELRTWLSALAAQPDAVTALSTLAR